MPDVPLRRPDAGVGGPFDPFDPLTNPPAPQPSWWKSRITGSAVVGGRTLYSWEEVVTSEADPTGWAVPGDAATGASNARELNDVTVPVGAVVWMRAADAPEGQAWAWEFAYAAAGGGEPGPSVAVEVVTRVCVTKAPDGRIIHVQQQTNMLHLPAGTTVDPPVCAEDLSDCCPGPAVSSPCCPSNPIPASIHLTTTSSVCASLAGSYVLTWDGGAGAWRSLVWPSGAYTYQWTFRCVPAAGNFELSLVCSGSLIYLATRPVASSSCAPLGVTFTGSVTGADTCCSGISRVITGNITL